jgi:ABC-type glycerol-3-phosphate transport system substrate-binding protein
MAKNKPKKLSRRDFLKLSSLAAGGSLLAACASTETAEPVEEVEAVEPDVEPTSEPEVEPTTIRMVTHWTGEDAHTASMALLYKRFQEANPDIKLDIVEIPDWPQANTKVATECSAGACPDIAFGQFVNTEVINAGLVYDTDAFVEEHKDVIDFAYQGAKYNDKYWKAFTSEISGFGCVYSKDLLAEIGLSEFPKTWDGLLEAGEAVKAKGKVLSTFQAYWPPLFGFIQQSTPEGNQASIDGDWDSPTWVQTMEYFQKWLPYLGPDELEMDDSIAPLRVVDGEMLFYCDGQWMIGNTGLEPAEAAAKLGVAPFPTPPGKTIAGWNGYAIGETVYVNPDDPKKVEASWRFLDFWCTDEEVIKSFIVDSQSPMGVRTDLITPELAGPFLPMFFEATSAADLPYTEVGAWPEQDTWGAVKPAFQALVSGATPEEAVKVMMDIFEAG